MSSCWPWHPIGVQGDTEATLSITDVQKQEPGEGSEAEEEDEDEEDLYTPLEANDDTSSENAVVIANRPPAPAPRPESSEMKNSKVPFIAQGNVRIHFFNIDAAMLEPENVCKQWLVQIRLSHCFYGNHYYQ